MVSPYLFAGRNVTAYLAWPDADAKVGTDAWNGKIEDGVTKPEAGERG